jgi:hypothetical protein
MRSTISLFALLVLAGSVEAGTICTNGRCFTCDGSSVCVNGKCTCNGVPAGGAAPLVPQGPCGDQPVVVHRNGGGAIATSATVAASVYVSTDSAVCGNAVVSDMTRLINGSVVNGRANVSGQSSLDRSTVNGNSMVSESVLRGSTLNGDARVSRSEVVSSVLNGEPVVRDAHVTSSVINGRASVVGRTIQGSVLNN